MQNASKRFPCPAIGGRGILRRCLGQKTTAEAVKEEMTDETMKFRATSERWILSSFFHLSEIMVQNI